MAPFRLPFSSKKSAPNGNVHNGGDVDVMDTNPYGRDKPSLAMNQKASKDEPNEFKLSSVNDSGEYLPPSPMEKKGTFWGIKTPSISSPTPRSALSDSEPFSMSRESFDSYRRSFDVSGRSPIVHTDSFTSRTSIDSRRLQRPSLSSYTFESPSRKDSADAGFEEVGLDDEKEKPPQPPKKRGFLARFGDSADTNTTTNSTEETKHHFSLIPGRKRGQSGTGRELGNMNQVEGPPSNRGMTEVEAR